MNEIKKRLLSEYPKMDLLHAAANVGCGVLCCTGDSTLRIRFLCQDITKLGAIHIAKLNPDVAHAVLRPNQEFPPGLILDTDKKFNDCLEWVKDNMSETPASRLINFTGNRYTNGGFAGVAIKRRVDVGERPLDSLKSCVFGDTVYTISRKDGHYRVLHERNPYAAAR